MCIPEGGFPAFIYLGVCGGMCMITLRCIIGIDTMDASTTWFGMAMLLFGYFTVLYLD